MRRRKWRSVIVSVDRAQKDEVGDVTSLCHSTTWYINLVKVAKNLAIIWALSKRGASEMHVDSTIPAMLCTIHETFHCRGSSNQSLHVKWTKDDTHFACSGEGNSSSSMGKTECMPSSRCGCRNDSQAESRIIAESSGWVRRIKSRKPLKRLAVVNAQSGED